MATPVQQSDDRPPSRTSRLRALVDVLVVFVATIATVWLVDAVPGWRAWDQSVFGVAWTAQILAFMLVPLLVLRLLGLYPGRLGITFGGILRPLEAGLTAIAVIGPATGLAFPLLGMLGWSPMEWRGGLLLAGVYAACLPLTGLVLRKARGTAAQTLPAKHLAIAAAAIAVATVIAALTADSAPIVPKVLIALLLIGPGEELVFRGIVQTRLDQAFGRPWRFFGADLGWGWVLASLLFGLAHFLSPSAPGLGGWALWTAVSGLLFGYIRAKSGSFVAPALVHGVLLAVAAFFS